METQVDDIFKNLKKPNKKKINSKRKGNSSELKICKIFSERFNQTFNRVPNSGAYGSTHNLSKNLTSSLAGDIITPENFYFVIENKAGYKIEFLNIYKETHTHKKTIYSFIEQGSKDAIRANRVPLIIYTKDRCQTVCIIPKNNHTKCNIINDFINQNNITYLSFYYKINISLWTEWIILSIEDFLKIDDKLFFN